MSHHPKMKPYSCLFLLLDLLFFSAQRAVGSVQAVNPFNLSCDEAGTFPIPGSCQSYYECQSFRGSLYPHPADCKSGTIFDQVSKECRSPSMVDDSSRCVADAAKSSTDAGDDVAGADYVPSKTSGNVESLPSHTPATTEKVPYTFPVDSSVQNTGICESVNGMSMCNDINIVSSYSSLVISNPSLRESFKRHEGFNIDAMNYIEDLETAKNNMRVWNNGDSILIEINQMYQLAIQYSMEFRQKYEVYQERIRDDVSKQDVNKDYIKKLEDDIRKLEEDIKTNEAGLNIADLPVLKQYFTNTIDLLKQELETKRQQISQENSGDADTARDLEELSYFLDLIKKDARQIENLAKNSNNRVQMLLENLQKDSVAFENYASEAGKGLHALTEEMRRYEETRKNITDEITKIEEEKQGMKNKTETLSHENDKIDVTVRELNQQIAAKREEFNKKVTKCETNNGTLRTVSNTTEEQEEQRKCVQALAPINIDEEIKKLHQHNELKKKNLIEITQIYNQIPSKIQEIENATKSLPSRDLSTLVDAELGRLRVFLSDVDNLKDNANSSKISLSEIKKGLQGVECQFGDIAKQFDLLRTRANTAQSDEDKQAKKAAIEGEVFRVDAQIQQLSRQISQLKECV